MASLSHIGSFPFCFPSKEKADEIDLIVAEKSPDYSGSYAGTLFPVKCELNQAMALFWRIKKINLTAKLSQIVTTTTETSITKTYDISEINNPFEITEFVATNSFNSLYSRVCGTPSSLSTKSKITSGTFFENLETGETINDISVREEGIEMDWFGYCPHEELRGISELKSEEGDEKNYFYFPYIKFTLSRYKDFWTTYFPHFSRTIGGIRQFTETGDQKNISIKIPDLDPIDMTIYQILFKIDPDPSLPPPENTNIEKISNFSDWSIELYEEE